MAVNSKTASSVNNYRKFVYKIVRKIPEGKVATYGQIAKKLQIPNSKSQINAQMVGWALHQNEDSMTPCHRVVDRNGRIASNFAFDGWIEQRRRLLAEGVKFRDEMHVDLSACLWQIKF